MTRDRTWTLSYDLREAAVPADLIRLYVGANGRWHGLDGAGVAAAGPDIAELRQAETVRAVYAEAKGPGYCGNGGSKPDRRRLARLILARWLRWARRARVAYLEARLPELLGSAESRNRFAREVYSVALGTRHGRRERLCCTRWD